MNYRRTHIENSKIFITIVTSKRRPILIENIDLLRNSFKQAKEGLYDENWCDFNKDIGVKIYE